VGSGRQRSSSSPFHQRTYFSAHPDLSYVVLNGDQPLTSSPYQQEGFVSAST
jgi:hypothetical protein